MEARRELGHIRKQLDGYHRRIGEVITYSAYNPAATTADDIYNEPGRRGYFTAVRVQTLWLALVEGGKRLTDERFDVYNNLTLAISAEALRNAGVPTVFDDSVRVFDIFKYWDRYWSVKDYDVIGRFPQGDSSTIGIAAVEIDLHSDYPLETLLPIE